MKKKSYKPYILLAIVLLLVFYLPSGATFVLRSGCVSVVKGGWRLGALGAAPFVEPPENSPSLQTLESENLLLKKQNEMLRQRLFSEERFDHLIKKIQGFSACEKESLSPFFERRKAYALERLNQELASLPAEVIYRNPSHWNSTLWINVGEVDNQTLKFPVVAVNSPILKRDQLIGVIDYVGKRKSRVRLLTDSSLIPSVRVARDEVGDRELLYRLEQLLSQLIFKEEYQEIYGALGKLKGALTSGEKLNYLAKGELYGSCHPLWRGRSDLLKGIGFNYDFEDIEGASLELRSGKPLTKINHSLGVSLIEVGDLLITTGMDGVFPPDLPVARVLEVEPLKEGSVSYTIKATLCAGNLDHLLDVVVLPPMKSDEDPW